MAVTKHDKNINTPKIFVLLILERKSGVIVTIRYTMKAPIARDLGKPVL
jgi:hypothetical protein